MKIGILGGSFNPPHQGHLHISKLALQKLKLKQLWWIPTPQNPLKPHNNFLNFEERIEACKSIISRDIIKVNPQIYVKKINNFYSIDLINLLQKKYKNYEFIWIMGDDNLSKFHKWHDFKNLIHKIEFAVFSREHNWHKFSQCPALKIYKKYTKKSKKLPKISILNNIKLNLSSTQIRHGKYL